MRVCSKCGFKAEWVPGTVVLMPPGSTAADVDAVRGEWARAQKAMDSGAVLILHGGARLANLPFTCPKCGFVDGLIPYPLEMAIRSMIDALPAFERKTSPVRENLAVIELYLSQNWRSIEEHIRGGLADGTRNEGS